MSIQFEVLMSSGEGFNIRNSSPVFFLSFKSGSFMGFFKSLLSAVNADNKTGTPFNFDENHTVYFRGKGVTETDAARTAGFFKGYGYFTETNQADIQIFSAGAGETVQVGFVIGGRSVSPETENFFRDASEGLQELFSGRPIKICLMDSNLQELKTL